MMSERVKLMQAAGRDLATQLLPAPFKLWYSDHSTGCQMTIVADVGGNPVDVWRGSLWYSHIYYFNERGKIAGLQPDFAFAKDVIDKYFADLQSAVDAKRKARDERLATDAAEAQARKSADIEAIRHAISA
jgi:hypothetical protein